MKRSEVCGINISCSALFERELVKWTTRVTNELFPEPTLTILLQTYLLLRLVPEVVIFIIC
jgi:hypothetical protein